MPACHSFITLYSGDFLIRIVLVDITHRECLHVLPAKYAKHFWISPIVADQVVGTAENHLN